MKALNLKFIVILVIDLSWALRMNDVHVPSDEHPQDDFDSSSYIELLQDKWREELNWNRYSPISGFIHEDEQSILSQIENFLPSEILSSNFERCMLRRDNFSPDLFLDGICLKESNKDEKFAMKSLPTLYRAFGGVLPSFSNILEQPSFIQYSTKDLEAQAAITFALSERGLSAPVYHVLYLKRLDIRHADNFAFGQTILQLRSRSRKTRPEMLLHPVQVGVIFYVELAGPLLKHRLAISLDKQGHYDILQHTYSPVDGGYAVLESEHAEIEIGADGSNTQENVGTEHTVDPYVEQIKTNKAENSILKIMTYNIWHTQPAPWSLKDPTRERGPRYRRRLEHLADIVRKTNPDIIGFQEVRYDSSFHQAQVRQLSQLLPDYQFLYQPAMLQFDINRFWNWEDEGVAIFSRHPIVNSDYVLLSRNLEDPRDDHQRVCLHAEVNVTGIGLVDVYATHLSLSEEARERSVKEMAAFSQTGRGKAQFLLGDFNAEPHEPAISFLQGTHNLGGMVGDFQDLWLQLHPEPQPNSTDSWERYNALTFPSCDPVKRIDFIFGRAEDAKLEVVSCELQGQDPTPDTYDKSLIKSIGMLDHNSPIWASDHRAVLAEVIISDVQGRQ